ncbi:unnamed protein product [Zymoseptoria tritici ST99CH_3D1]|uniref:Uncharacterized protein n=2 Tax=Zymoseptoria tritici TaxID=1047171 RepID=A0A1X7RV00_ZYMT9|nr:unnamed protein product [Zymoseptoria tritici ST99CH_3D7]SMR54738.1 unnamed protein product [Zymoseptoria tritici ST99CH_3D1]
MVDEKVIVDDDRLEPSVDGGFALELADLDDQLLEIAKEEAKIAKKQLESKRRKLLLAQQLKSSTNIRPRGDARPAAQTTTRGTKRTLDAVDDTRRTVESKRMKTEPGIERPVLTMFNFIDLTTPPPPEIATPEVPRRPTISYAESPGSDYADQEAMVMLKSQHKYTPINIDYPSICRMPDGSLAELRCFHCGANAAYRKGDPFWLEAGASLHRHYITHREFYARNKLNEKEMMQRSVYKTLSNAEVTAVTCNIGPKYIIEPVFDQQSQAQFRKRDAVKKERRVLPSPTPASSIDEDDDDENDSKPLVDRWRAGMKSPMAQHMGGMGMPSIDSPVKVARKSAPGGGGLVNMWQRSARK